jgi:hypothetical protein
MLIPRTPVVLMGVFALSGFLLATAPADEPKPDKDGFVSLFNGKDLERMEDRRAGAIVVGKGRADRGPRPRTFAPVLRRTDWKNFHFKAEVMTFPKANSGIYFHTQFQEKGFPDKGFECQVNCSHTDWKKTGGLYDIKDTRDPHQKDNTWFLYEIIVEGNHVLIKIDGQTVTDWTQPDGFKPPPGHPQRVIDHGTFAFQGHDPNSEVHYKNIVVKALD